MSETEPTDDEPIDTIEHRRINAHTGRVIIPKDTYNVGTVLDVVINGPADAVAIADAVVKTCGPRENAINTPHEKFDVYDIEPGQYADVEVMEIVRHAE